MKRCIYKLAGHTIELEDIKTLEGTIHYDKRMPPMARSVKVYVDGRVVDRAMSKRVARRHARRYVEGLVP